jgi:CRISPR-associated endonuclease Cas2
MPRRDLVLLAYDVACDRRRARVLDAVRGFGIDAQLSVHECRFTAAERREIWRRVTALVAPDDRVLMLVLDPRARVETLGTARAPLDPAFHYIG